MSRKPLSNSALGLCLATALVVTAGCGRQTVSGTYVDHDANSVILLQLTQTQDARLTGSWQIDTLDKSGAVKKTLWNVEGVVDGDKLTLSVKPNLLTPQLNLGGTWNSDAIELNLPGGGASDGLTVHHLAKGSISDFDTSLKALNERGQTIVASANRAKEIDRLNQSAAALTSDLHAFVSRVTIHMQTRKPKVEAYFTNAIQHEQANAARIAQLLNTKNGLAISQAGLVDSQAGLDYMQIANVYEQITQGQQKEANEVATLESRIAAFDSGCLDGKAAAIGDVVPEAEACKELAEAVGSFHALLPARSREVVEVDKLTHASKQRLDALKVTMDDAVAGR